MRRVALLVLAGAAAAGEPQRDVMVTLAPPLPSPTHPPPSFTPPTRGSQVWCGAGDDAQRSATEAYLAAHRASLTAVSPTIYGVSPTGQLTVSAGGNTSKQSPEEWAASLHTNHGLRVVPIIYADDSHTPVGLQKLRLLAATPAPFTAALVAQATRTWPLLLASQPLLLGNRSTQHDWRCT